MAHSSREAQLDGDKLADELNVASNDLAGRSEEGLAVEDDYELERVEKVYR